MRLVSTSRKNALGRRLFVTKEGYFSISSKTTRPEDRVAVSLGFGVLFIQGKRSQDMRRRGWQISGETYTQGAMQEAIGQWEMGMAEAVVIKLS